MTQIRCTDDNNGVGGQGSLALVQQAYVQARTQFELAARARQELLEPVIDGLPDAPEDGRETRMLVDEETGYWKAYDALYQAGDRLLAWAATWLLEHSDTLVREPVFAMLVYPIPMGLRDIAIALALQIQTD